MWEQQLVRRLDQWRAPFEHLSTAIATFPTGPLGHLSHLFENFPTDVWHEYGEIKEQAFALFVRLGISGLELSLIVSDFKAILKVQAEEGDDAALRFIFEIFRE